MRNVKLTADHINDLAVGGAVTLTDESGKGLDVDGGQLSTDQISALCDGGRVLTRSADGSEVALLGARLT
jgi:hypothetical protein